MWKWLIGLALIFVVLPAWAQTRDTDKARCNGNDLDPAVIQWDPQNAEKLTELLHSEEACAALIKSGRETSANLAVDYFNLGLAFSKMGFYDNGIANYTKAIKLEPDYASAYSDRGADYGAKGIYDQAIADLDKAIALKPEYASAYSNRAWVYHLKGEDSRALPDIEKAVTLAPKVALYIEIRAEIYEKLGQRDKAVADYRAALEVDPNMMQAQEGLKRLGIESTTDQNRANCGKTMSMDKNLIIASCTALIQSGGESTPNLADDYTFRGMAYTSAGEQGVHGAYDLAIADFTLAISLEPDSDSGYSNRAYTYHQEGEDAKALPDAEKAITLAPKECDKLDVRAEAYELRAEIFAKLGEREKAIADFRTALKCDPGDDDVKLGLRSLGASP